MPRFVLETQMTTETQRERMARLAAERFPEVAVEEWSSGGTELDRERWVCRSSSEAQLQQWVHEAGLVDVDIERVEGLGATARPSTTPTKGLLR
jgi:hypothetical protein